MILSKKTNYRTQGLDLSGPIVPEVLEFGVKIKAQITTTELAVCLPSYPLSHEKLVASFADGDMRDWWDYYRHDIYCGLQIAPGLGPLILVLEKLDTPQYANCYYKGSDREINFRLAAQVLNRIKLTVDSGFRISQAGNLDFLQSDYDPNSTERFVIFIRTAKIGLISFKRLKERIVYQFQ